MQPIVPQPNNQDHSSPDQDQPASSSDVVSGSELNNSPHTSQEHAIPDHGSHHRVEPTGDVKPAQTTTPFSNDSYEAPQQAHVYTAPDAPVADTAWQPSAPSPAAAQWQAPEHNIPAASWSAVESVATNSLTPQAVVQVLSPRGVEYVFLTISLFTAAFGLAAALLSAVNGQFGYATLSFPVALLLVGLPVFALLFLHLKKAELLNPGLALDPSKRRSTQVTQVICFVICLFSLVGLVVAVFSKMGGQLSTSVGKIVLDVGVLLLVFGAILFYYWRDEHHNELGQ